MKSLAHQLLSLKSDSSKKNAPALMTHVVLGYPTLSASIDIVRAMADGGAKFVELQIPFSDPMADGPTIMAANEKALANGVHVKDCFRAAEKIARSVDIPILFMSYFNLVYRYNHGKDGIKHFCKDAASVGVHGLIVPDVPPEENSEGYWSITQEYGISPIPIVSPLSTQDRMTAIKKVTDDSFVYCVSTTGTTGARKQLPAGLGRYLQRVKKQFSRPTAVGFGISTREQVRAVGQSADIAIVGSAMINVIAKIAPNRQAKAAENFVAKLLR